MQKNWAPIVRADWMAAYAGRNASTGRHGLAPPMYVVRVDTAPHAARNSAFGEEVPEVGEEVNERRTPLPVEGGSTAVYEGRRGGKTLEAHRRVI